MKPSGLPERRFVAGNVSADRQKNAITQLIGHSLNRTLIARFAKPENANLVLSDDAGVTKWAKCARFVKIMIPETTTTITTTMTTTIATTNHPSDAILYGESIQILHRPE